MMKITSEEVVEIAAEFDSAVEAMIVALRKARTNMSSEIASMIRAEIERGLRDHVRDSVSRVFVVTTES